jgi:hypothetical protein
MIWSDYYNALITMLQVADPSGQTNFNIILRRLIDDAELMIFRHPKLDFLATRTSDRTQQTTAGMRTVPIPSPFIIIEDMTLITPTGTQPHTMGASRVPLLRVERAFLDMVWPQETLTQAPVPFETYYAIFDMQQAQSPAPLPQEPIAGIALNNSRALVAPTPDANYVVEYQGTYRPARFYDVAGFDPGNPVGQQYANNPQATTFLSTWMPDLLLSASMVFGTAYQKNWSAMGDDPRQALSWMKHFNDQIMVVSSEEFRKKMMGWNWTVYPMPDAAAMEMPPAPPQAA